MRMRDVDVSGPSFPRKRRIFHSPFMFFFVPECALLCTLGINSRNDIMLRGLRGRVGMYPGGKSCCFCFRMRVEDEEGGISQLCLCPALYIQDQRHDQRTIQELYEDKEHYYFSEAVACGQNDCAGLQHLLK